MIEAFTQIYPSKERVHNPKWEKEPLSLKVPAGRGYVSSQGCMISGTIS